MEYIIEFFLDLILEGSFEISNNKKVSKWIRYPAIILITLFFSIVVIGLFILGLLLLKNSIIGYIFIFLSIFMALGCFIKFKKVYKNKKSEDKK